VVAIAAAWPALQISIPATRYFSLSLRAEAAPVASEATEFPTANAVRIERTGDRTKLIFGLSTSVSPPPLSWPILIVSLRLPQPIFVLDPESGNQHTVRTAKPAHRASDLGSSLRESRVLSLIFAPQPGSCERLAKKAMAMSHTSLVIELAKTDRAISVPRSNRADAVRALAQTKKDEKPQPTSVKPVVMIDPGHGGIDRRRDGERARRKDLVFDFAKAVAAKLETDGRFKLS